MENASRPITITRGSRDAWRSALAPPTTVAVDLEVDGMLR
jgi:hypothetical protein